VLEEAPELLMALVVPADVGDLPRVIPKCRAKSRELPCATFSFAGTASCVADSISPRSTSRGRPQQSRSVNPVCMVIVNNRCAPIHHPIGTES
jgi:hypothetical protein